MTDRCCPRLRTALIVCFTTALGAGVLSGCAGTETTSEQTLYDREAFATRPHLKMSWRELLNPPASWDYRPREYATPHYRKATDEMYVGTDDGVLYKLRGGDGAVLWREQLDGAIHAEPLYGDGRVYAGTLDGRLYALDESSGEQIWSMEVDGSVESRAAFAEGRLLFTTTDNVLTAVDAATGKRLWSFRRTAPEYFTIKESSKPIVEDGVAYCGFADGSMVALQLDTGEVIWQSDLSGGKTEFIDVDEAPVIAGDRMFAASYDGGLYAIDRTSGEHIWRRDISGIADFTYGDESLYVATANGRLISVDTEDGNVNWGFRFQDFTPVAISASRLYLFVSTSSGPMYAIDRNSGVPLMKWHPSSGFNTPVVFGHSGGFVLSNRGYLYSFDVAY